MQLPQSPPLLVHVEDIEYPDAATSFSKFSTKSSTPPEFTPSSLFALPDSKSVLVSVTEQQGITPFTLPL